MNRIKILREENLLTQKELAEKVQLSEGSISLYEKEERKPSLEVLVKLSDIFNCSIDYLLGRSDYRTKEEEKSNYLKNIDYSTIRQFIMDNSKEFEKIKINKNNIKSINDYILLFTINFSNIEYNEFVKLYLQQFNTEDIEHLKNLIEKTFSILNKSEKHLAQYNKLISLINNKDFESNVFPIADIPVKVPVIGKISAGLPILATENIEGYEFAPSSYIKEGFDYFYLKVDGDSMNLKFNNGDVVLVQKQDTLENDEIGVILVDDEATVKKFKHENDMIILYPMSTNPEHTVQIYKTEQIKIIGKVISYQGKI